MRPFVSYASFPPRAVRVAEVAAHHQPCNYPHLWPAQGRLDLRLRAMLEPGKITRSGGISKGSVQKDTLLKDASKALIRQGKKWVIARPPTPVEGGVGGELAAAVEGDRPAGVAGRLPEDVGDASVGGPGPRRSGGSSRRTRGHRRVRHPPPRQDRRHRAASGPSRPGAGRAPRWSVRDRTRRERASASRSGWISPCAHINRKLGRVDQRSAVASGSPVRLDRFHQPPPRFPLRLARRLADRDLEVGHLALDLLGRQHVQAGHEDRASRPPPGRG